MAQSSENNGNGDTRQKIAEFGAYIKILSEDAKGIEEDMSDFRETVVMMSSEVDHLRTDTDSLLKIRDSVISKLPLMEKMCEDHSEKIRCLDRSFYRYKLQMNKRLKRYDEMQETYLEIRSMVVKAIVGALLAGIGGGVGTTVLLSLLGGG